MHSACVRNRRLLVLAGMGILASIFVVAAGAQGAGDEVGARTCAGCHQEAFEVWQSSPHAKASDLLVGAHREDRACQQCHVPSRETGMTGVQCETCHGGGRYYFAEYVMRDSELARLVGLKDPTEATCLECHDANSPRLVPFDYQSARERIRHW